MALHDFDEARAIHQALNAVFARELGGADNPEAFRLVSKLCDGAVEAINDVDCRVAIRGVKSLAALLYSADGHRDIHSGSLHGAEALRFQILNALANFRGRLDVLQSQRPSRPERPALSKQRLRILIIEDNRDSADTLQKLLEVCGYMVASAYTALDGLELAKEMRPDVVLCDIGLPDTDGYTLAAQLRAEPATASARLIALTAYGAELDHARSRKAGFDLHLVKPVSPTALLEQLEGKQAQQSITATKTGES
jgi:CheY-like chemotaxis protein